MSKVSKKQIEKIKSIADDVRRSLGRNNGEWVEYDRTSSENPHFEVNVRHYGEWEFPHDCDQDEDDGDYDWEELSDETAEFVSSKISAIAAENPDFRIDWETGEKNWIDITVSMKETSK